MKQDKKLSSFVLQELFPLHGDFFKLNWQFEK